MVKNETVKYEVHSGRDRLSDGGGNVRFGSIREALGVVYLRGAIWGRVMGKSGFTRRELDDISEDPSHVASNLRIMRVVIREVEDREEVQ